MTNCFPSASVNVDGFAYDPSNKLLYVANYFPNTVSAIRGNTIVANYPLPAQPYMLAYDSQIGHVYATAGADLVYLVV
jgi:DNA-binding beta-propeller fold protein YncE